MNEKIQNPSPDEINLERINEGNRGTLMASLGIHFTLLSKGRCEAVMGVEKKVCQPFGILHGGATLALAETVAGQGSLMLCGEGEVPAGIQVSGNHLSPAREGETVHAVGTILQQGRTIHIWNIDVTAGDGRIISTVRVVNSILKRR
ncbi:MAG TPA: PaaI family thioesterase [Proteiniphilum sp.]|nr:PaaI family thioesterase [Proteiniphilum sp.]HPJ50814.1 PaaI family thioesterase [Proteiniphilum sp.]HPR20181.1 PaaI family thioesterase [Proteiniphilum sp.]